MNKLMTAATEWLDADDWDYQTHQHDNVYIRAGFCGKSSRFNLVLDTCGQEHCFFVFVYFLSKTPNDRFSDVCELLTRINYGLSIGNFEFDFRDGEIRYKASTTVEGSELSPDMIKTMVYASLNTSDEYFHAIMSVIYGGKTPIQAIESVRDARKSEYRERSDAEETTELDDLDLNVEHKWGGLH